MKDKVGELQEEYWNFDTTKKDVSMKIEELFTKYEYCYKEYKYKTKDDYWNTIHRILGPKKDH